MKNLLYILALLILLGCGVFIYTQRSAETLALDGDAEAVSAQTLTAAYIGRRQILDSISIDDQILSDSRYTSLRSFSKPMTDRPIGRPNPFEPAAAVSVR